MLTSANSGIAIPAGAFVFASIAVLKLVLLVDLGPIWWNDTAYYVDYANRLLASADWLHNAGLWSAAIPHLLFNTVGYPMVLAAAMQTGGSAWPYLVITLQFFMSFVAAWALYRTAIALGLKRWISLTCAAAYLLSLPILFDQSLLTDSLHASIFIVAVCLLATDIRRERALRFKVAAIAGLLLALAFLIREALQFLVIAVVPLLAVSAWIAGRAAWWRSALACGLVLLPLVVVVEAYQSWNYYRTGMRFVSTTAQFAIPFALETAAQSDPIVIAGDTLFDRIARENFTSNSDNFNRDVDRFDEAMFKAGYNAVDQSKLAYENYFMNWLRHPRAMLEILRSNVIVRGRVTRLIFSPYLMICDTFNHATDTRDHCYRYRVLIHNLRSQFSALQWTAPISFVFQTLEHMLAIVLFSGFLLGIPISVVWRAIYGEGGFDTSWLIVTAFWLMWLIWFIGYGIVHAEERYFIPVLPASIVGGLFYWQHVFARFRDFHADPPKRTS